MCLSKAYLETEGESEPILDDIASVEVNEDQLIFTTLLGEEKEVPGELDRIDFQNNELYVKGNFKSSD